MSAYTPHPEFSVKPRAARLAVRAAVPLAALLAAFLLAAVAYARFLEAPRRLWTSCLHDRNAHYLTAQNLGLHLREGDVGGVLKEVHRARVWGPLHGLAAAIPQAVLGPDYRLAVLPSLAGWIGAAFFGFLAARRTVPRGGNLAGLAAAVFILASPAHQAFAVDVMLESPGACLSLLAIYCYLRAAQEPSAGNGRLLGLALTALFLLKYNYWLLVALAIAGAEAVSHPDLARRALREAPGLLRRQAREALRWPLGFAAILLFGAAGVLILTEGGSFTVAGREVAVRFPFVLLQAAYTLAFVEGLRWWLRSGRGWHRRQAPPARQLTVWHLWPAALWLLWPKKFGYFVWFLGPSNHAGGRASPLEGLPACLGWIAGDYHITLWSCALAAALALAAAATWPRMRRGAAVLPFLLGLSLLLAAAHPNRQSRFLHTWVPALWVLSGAGAAVLVYGRRTAGRPLLRHAAAGVTAAVLGAAHLPSAAAGGRAPGGGPRADRPSTLDLTDPYLPYLESARRPVLLSDRPLKFLAAWTYQERYPDREPPRTEVPGLGPDTEENRRITAAWLAETRPDAFVYVEIPPGSPYYEPVAGPIPHPPAAGAAAPGLRLARQWLVRGAAIRLWLPLAHPLPPAHSPPGPERSSNASSPKGGR